MALFSSKTNLDACPICSMENAFAKKLELILSESHRLSLYRNEIFHGESKKDTYDFFCRPAFYIYMGYIDLSVLRSRLPSSEHDFLGSMNHHPLVRNSPTCFTCGKYFDGMRSTIRDGQWYRSNNQVWENINDVCWVYAGEDDNNVMEMYPVHLSCAHRSESRKSNWHWGHRI